MGAVLGRLRQTRILTKKNWFLHVRNWKSTLAQILIPCLLLSLLMIINAATKNQAGENATNVLHSTVSPAPNMIPKCRVGPGLDKCYTFVYNNAAHPVVAQLITKVLGKNGLTSSDVLAISGNATDVNSYLYNNNNVSQAAFVFNFPETLPTLPTEGSLYTLQINTSLYTGVCTTEQSTYAFWQCPSTMRDLLLPMQRSLNEAILEVTTTATSPSLPLGLLPEPHPPYVTRNGPAAPLFYLFALMFPFVLQLMALVREKELKLRYALRIIGVKESAIFISWGLTNFVLYLMAIMVYIVFGAACQQYMFLKNDFGTYFFLFLLFALAMTALGMFLSALVFTASPARNLALFVLFFFGLFSGLGAFVYADSVGDSVGDGWRYFLALFAPIIMNKGLTDLNQLTLDESKPGMRWADIGNNTVLFPMSQVYSWLIIDTVIYSVLAWYLWNVLPDAMGVTRKPWFLCQRSYWCTPRPDALDRGTVSPEAEQYLSLDPEIAYEGEDTDVAAERIKIKSGQARAAAVELYGLRKIYKSCCKGSFTAVDGVSLSIEDNSLFCLLGPNGAGKTTTINTLTGGLSVTAGSARIHGLDVQRDVAAVRSIMGVCPQFDVLWDELSGEQNIALFAELKGLSGDDLTMEIKTRLAEVDLTGDAKQLPSNYSGGMRRRLSVAMALVGNPRIIFLDEPTTGMDPVSRRAVWSIIQKAKEGRAVVLTTHSMEEADALADRIGIMAKGKLRCIGTSMHLKHKFGSGYRVAVIASAGELEGVLREMTSLYPFATPMYSTPVAATLQVTTAYMDRLPQLFRYLQNHPKVKDFQLSLTTLEDVFLRISKEVHGENSVDARDFQRTNAHGPTPIPEMTTVPPNPTNCKQVKALFAKSCHVQKRKRISNCCQICLPSLIILILVFLQIVVLRRSADVTIDPVPNPDTIPLSAIYIGARPSTPPVPPLSIPYVGGSAALALLSRVKWGLPDPVWRFTQYVAYADQGSLEDAMYASFGSKASESTPFGLIFNSITPASGVLDVTVAYNRSNVLSFNVLSSAVDNLFHPFYRLASGGVSLANATMFSPFPSQASVTKFDIVALIAGVLFPLILFFQFPIFVGSIMYDKERKLIEIMKMMGLKMQLYWLVQILFCFLLYFLVIFVLLIVGGGVKFTIFTQNAFGTYFILFMLWGTAMISMAFLFTTFFAKERTATIASYLLVIASFVAASALTSLVEATPAGRGLYSIYPYFAFSRGVSYLAQAARSKTGLKMADISNPGGLGEVYAFLACETILCVFLTWYIGQVAPVGYGVKRSPLFLCQRKYWRSVCGKKARQDDDIDLPDLTRDTPGGEDDDIQLEREHVMSSAAQNEYAIRIVDLKKAYGKKVAVKGASFGVRKGECLGLLGHNGAGKTTIASMLSGLVEPTSGDAFVMDWSIRDDMDRIYAVLGVCPQHDLLWDNMTAREHLFFYGRIKGLSGTRLAGEVQRTLAQLSLEAFGNKQAGSFSGGMKRRLSIGIALIGLPRVIFLDEPTTGLDPGHRRDIWRVIAEATTTGASIVLTTHSMEEAEALSDRIAIMAAGKLRAIGTSAHLKGKFAAGYALSFNLHPDAIDHASVENLKHFVSSFCPSAVYMLTSMGPSQHFHIPAGDTVRIDTIFSTVEQNKQKFRIADWVLSQTTLHDVFLRISDDVHAEEMAANDLSATGDVELALTHASQEMEMIPASARMSSEG